MCHRLETRSSAVPLLAQASPKNARFHLKKAVLPFKFVCNRSIAGELGRRSSSLQKDFGKTLAPPPAGERKTLAPPQGTTPGRKTLAPPQHWKTLAPPQH